jgi:hypothetical protein
MQDLADTGFLKFAENKANSSNLMFESSSADWSKWGNRYIDTVIGKNRHEICMHSLRHNFKQIQNACKGLSTNVANKIFGHSPEYVWEQYGRTLTVDEAKIFLETARCPIDLNKYIK